ncbi:MAG: septum formation family protein [Propionicimonas sp.]|uniref:septum formation family protein n=1 Tax=Propionicimonas sp. TaxID=1955623 RepID=UPI002B21F965|nr:septum formation family protein [Propionicimonas sp.]MEA4943729.1 septum formation family protein [Propionicimonas sp.]MEA5055698.1 septum formation family protein [Propionicimonas sp.]
MIAVASRLGPALAAGLLGCALLSGCGADPGPRDSGGTVTAPADVDAYALRLGDCTGPVTTGSASRFTLLPCGEEHSWEVFAATDLAGDDFPGAVKVQSQAEAFCNDQFTSFVGKPVAKSGYHLIVLQPTKQTWTSAGDRAVTCLAGSRDGGVTGTLKGAAA